VKVPFDEAVRRAALVLEKAGASEAQAVSTAVALVRAEAQGLTAHGLSLVTQFASHLRHGRIEGEVEPAIAREHGAAVLVDAKDGFAFPACDIAITRAVQLAKKSGVALAAVMNSHHAGVLVDHLRPAAREGLVGVAFANAPASANAVAAIFPRRGRDPLMVDLGLAGIGGIKGTMLALVVDVLAAALTGSHFGFEASPFTDDGGNRPRIAQAFILIDPWALAGRDVYDARIETLVAQMLVDDEVRLPGVRRLALEHQAREEGVELPAGL
jgi:(2R)-3-sulfolactate dehydrogenase (NADP+)